MIFSSCVSIYELIRLYSLSAKRHLSRSAATRPEINSLKASIKHFEVFCIIQDPFHIFMKGKKQGALQDL